MRTQINKIELFTSGNAIPLAINGQCYDFNDSISDFGLNGKVLLSKRLMKLIVVLALYRIYANHDGWITLKDLCLKVDYDTNKTKSKRSGLVNFIQRHFNLYREEFPHNNSYLLEYRPKSEDTNFGLSKGPYRIGVPPSRIQLDPAACWSFLLERNHIPVVEQISSSSLLIENVHQRIDEGEYINAHLYLRKYLELWYLTPPSSNSSQLEFADCWDLLSNIEMTLGLSQAALQAAKKAQEFYTAIGRQPLGIAHSLEIQSHALSQMGRKRESVNYAQQALRHIDNTTKEHRLGMTRAKCSGALGQKLTRVGQVKKAENILLRSQKVSEDYGSISWYSNWSLRLVENAIKQGNITKAEKLFADINEFETSLKTDIKAIYYHVGACLFISMGDFKEAKEFAKKSLEIGQLHNMIHQIKKTLPLLQKLDSEGYSTDFHD